MAVLAPMPSAMVITAVAANTGLFRKVRTAYAKSRNSIGLLIAQCHQRVNLGGAPRGQVSGHDGYQQDRERRNGEGGGIERAEAEELTSPQASGSQRRRNSNGDSNREKHQRLPEPQPKDAA